MAGRKEESGLLAAARKLDNRVYGPAPSNNVFVNVVMHFVRARTAGLLLALAALSLVAAPILALVAHPGLATDSLSRAACFAALSLASHVAWQRWGHAQ